MIKLSKKSFIIGKDPFKGIYLQFSFKIIEDTFKKVRYEILDENKNSIYNSDLKYISTPLEINNISYLNLTSFKNLLETNIDIVVYTEDNESESFNETININNFYLGDIETRIINNETVSYFNWTTEAFTVQDLYGRIKIFNQETNITKFSSLKSILNGSTQNKISSINIQDIINKLQETNNPSLRKINYKLEILDSEKNIVKNIPETGWLEFDVSYENEKPNLRFSNTQLKKYGNCFQLETDLIFHDSNIDDVKFIIEDNQGNVLLQEDYYSYTPRIQKLIYNYDIKYFNSLFLELNSKVTDNLTFSETKTDTVKLFSVENIRIRRNRLYWDVRNYSNSLLKTNVEILNINNELIYSGKIVTNKTELDYITMTDDQEIELFSSKYDILGYNYYKFRIKVRCDEEGYTEYVEFDTGTLSSTQHHPVPIVTIDRNDCELIRDEDDNKKIHLKFNINGKVGEYFKYSIYDDSGNSIYKSNDFISFPEKTKTDINTEKSYKNSYNGNGIDFDMTFNYDFCKQLSTEITIKAVTEYEKEGTDAIVLDSYYIRNLDLKRKPTVLNHIVTFQCDNYSIYDLNIYAEIYKFIYEIKTDENNHQYKYYNLEKLTTEYGTKYKEFNFVLSPTLETINQELRIIPKLPINGIISYDSYGMPKEYEYYLYGIRLRVDCPALGIIGHKYIYPEEYKDLKILLKSIPQINTPPTIDINWVNPIFYDDYKKLKVNISATFADGDFDNMWSAISDRYDTIYDSNGYLNYGENNSINIVTSKIYELENINTSFLKFYFKNIDEDGSKVEEYYNIPLHVITNISYMNGTFNWCYRLYNKSTVNMILEILDSSGYLYYVSKPIKCNFTNKLVPVKEVIDLNNFEAGNYRYRIRTFNPNEAWNYYFPNQNGNYMELSEHVKLNIDINSVTVNKGTATIKKTITSSVNDGRQFTFYIYDDSDE